MDHEQVAQHIAAILEAGRIIMTPGGPLGPADVERLALGEGMSWQEAATKLSEGI